MALIPEPNQELPSREDLERSFANAEANLRLEGMTPTPFFFALKEHVLSGEITFDQAAEAVNHYHRPDLDPQVRERAKADPVGFCRSIEAGRRLIELGGTMPDLENPKRFRFDEYWAKLDAAEKSGQPELKSEVPSWNEVFAALDAAKLPDDFMSEADRDRRPVEDRPALNQLFEDDSVEGKDRQ